MVEHQQDALVRLVRDKDRHNPQRWSMFGGIYFPLNRRKIIRILSDPNKEWLHVGKMEIGPGIGRLDHLWSYSLHMIFLLYFSIIFQWMHSESHHSSIHETGEILMQLFGVGISWRKGGCLGYISNFGREIFWLVRFALNHSFLYDGIPFLPFNQILLWYAHILKKKVNPCTHPNNSLEMLMASIYRLSSMDKPSTSYSPPTTRTNSISSDSPPPHPPLDICCPHSITSIYTYWRTTITPEHSK